MLVAGLNQRVFNRKAIEHCLSAINQSWPTEGGRQWEICKSAFILFTLHSMHVTITQQYTLYDSFLGVLGVARMQYDQLPLEDETTPVLLTVKLEALRISSPST